eukprot:jgi/Chrpa1/19823/Chrysochromulina_OHIO_Genome00025609-RA
MPLVPVAEPRFSCQTVLPIRFRVLAAFAAVSFLQGASFSVFALNPDLSILLLPSLTRNLEGWTLNCNNIAQAGFIFIAIYLLRERPSPAPTGLRTIAVIGSLTQFVQSFCWYVATLVPSAEVQVWLVLFGSSAGGVCTGCVQGACSRISAVWFPPDERSGATGNVYSAYFAGQLLFTAISLFFCADFDVLYTLHVQLGLSVLNCIIILAWFPDRPVSDESPLKIYRDTLISRATRDATRGASTRGTHTRDGTRSTGGGLLDRLLDRSTQPADPGDASEGARAGARSRSVAKSSWLSSLRNVGLSSVLLIISVSWSTGVYQAYGQVLPLAFANEGGATYLPCNYSAYARFSNAQGDRFALASTATYAIGGSFGGMVADRFFERRLKRLVLLCYLALTINFGLIIMSMPPPPFFVTNTGGVSFGPGGEPLAIVLVATSGLFSSMATVPALELLAEAATLSEGASNNLVMLGTQIFGIMLTYLSNVIATPGLGILICIFIICCSVIVSPITERYARFEAIHAVVAEEVAMATILEQTAL